MKLKEIKNEIENYINSNRNFLEKNCIEFNNQLIRDLLKQYNEFVLLNKGCNKSFLHFLDMGVNNYVASGKTTSIVEELGYIYDKALVVVNRDVNCLYSYFKEVNKIYEKYNNNFNIEYTPENKDLLLKMNLKTVIGIARHYQGLGVSLNDLIGAGNLGLCVAFEKFKPNKYNTKSKLLSCLESFQEDAVFTYNDIIDIFKDHISYGTLHDKFLNSFEDGKEYTYKDIEKWINKNVKSAKFNSIANMWVRAYIMEEINNNSELVRAPKKQNNKDDEDVEEYFKDFTESESKYNKNNYLCIDEYISEDDGITVGDLLNLTSDDDIEEDIEVRNNEQYFQETFAKLFKNIKERDKRIVMLKFGIGYPCEMSLSDIAKLEGLSDARCSQVYNATITKIKQNAAKYKIDGLKLMMSSKKLV